MQLDYFNSLIENADTLIYIIIVMSVRLHEYSTSGDIIRVKTRPGEDPETAKTRVFMREYNSAFVVVKSAREIKCEGCIADAPGQKHHMSAPDGCLYTPGQFDL